VEKEFARSRVPWKDQRTGQNFARPRDPKITTEQWTSRGGKKRETAGHERGGTPMYKIEDRAMRNTEGRQSSPKFGRKKKEEREGKKLVEGRGGIRWNWFRKTHGHLSRNRKGKPNEFYNLAKQ